MMAAIEYKGSWPNPRTSLMASNWIHGPLGQNGGATPKMVLKTGIVLMIADDSDPSWT
jgi:hypothetical protein